MKIITKKEGNTKRKYYFLNIPIIKIKDKGYYKTIYIFGIKIRKINKKKTKKENKELKNISLNILKNRNNIEKEKIAVFLSGYGAVAEYQTKLFTSLDNKYDIFTNSENLEQFNFLKSISKKDCQNIIPYINLDKLNNKEKYLAKIFVLGDSFHHIETLKEAIKTKGERNRYIMLPEPILLSLFLNYSRMDKIEFKKLMIKIYPFLKDEFQDLDLYKISIKNNCYFIKYLIDLTGIHDFIVYTKHNKERILKELNREKIDANIKLIYHSYEELKDISKLNIERKNNEFIIGTFGGPSNLKQTKEIIEATNILNKIIIEVLNELDRLSNVSATFKYNQINKDYLKEICSLVLNGKNVLIANLNASYNKNINEVEYFSDGVRIFENNNDDESGSVGRMMIAITSINFARLGLEFENDTIKNFYNKLDFVLETVKNELLLTFETIGNKNKDNYDYFSSKIMYK